jgi:hypothetical protein
MRVAAFDHIRRLNEIHEHLTAKELKPGFLFQGERIPLVNPQRGIFKPQQSSSMRFHCGTVGAINIPSQMQLMEIDRGGAIQFRLLVIASDGSGRVLASAEGLKPLQEAKSPERQPLLRLRETDIGDQLWRVDLDDRNGPWLVINSRVPGLASQLRSSVLVQGLILPHALRVVLNGMPSEGVEEEDEDWGNDWRKFLEQLDLPTEP